MSAQNRTDLKALIAAWTAVLDLEVNDKPTMQHILDSVILSRDVQNSIVVPGAGTTNVNFLGYDTIDVSTPYDCVLNIQNIVDGDVKFLHIHKTAGVQVTFSGAVDQSMDVLFVNDLEDVVFLVTKKHYTTILLYPLMLTGDFYSKDVIDSFTGGLKMKRIPFTWSMPGNTQVDFQHGISNWQSVNIVSVMIRRNDTPTNFINLFQPYKAGVHDGLDMSLDYGARVMNVYISIFGTIHADIATYFYGTAAPRGYVDILYTD